MEDSRRAFIKRAIASTARAQSPGVSGFDHVALPMQNVDAMLAFYRALGFQVNEGAQVCSVHFGQNMINFHRPALWQSGTFTLRAAAAKPPCGDLCFVFDGTPAALKALIEKVGAAVETGPVNRQGGRQATGSSTYIRDPDQNLLEFIIYP
jgi:catechol 2,3-dioxygenase-like lactoylglutathione lyase family enzyme